MKDRTDQPIAPDGQAFHNQPHWRKDFPIDVVYDQYVSRREFTKFLVLTSLAFASGQLWILFHSLFRGSRVLPRKHIGTLNDIKPGGVLSFSYPNLHDYCLLVRTKQDQLVAYGQKCTHLSCAVRPQVEKGVFECPCHQGIFDMKSGAPRSGPASRPLDRIELEVIGQTIFAVGITSRTV